MQARHSGSEVLSDAAHPEIPGGWFLVVALSLAALVYAAKIVVAAKQNIDGLDFNHYYTAAYAMRLGVNPYTTNLAPMARSLGLRTEGVSFATNPPALILALEPLTLFKPHTAFWIWFAINLSVFGAFLAIILAEFPFGSGIVWCLGCLAVIYPPVVVHFHYAQAQIAILLGLLMMVRWLERGKDAVAGLALAFTILVKVFPVFLCGYLLVRRRWKALEYAAIGIASGAAITVGAIGLHTCLSFFPAAKLITTRHWLVDFGNTSIYAFVSRPFWYLACIGIGSFAERARVPAFLCTEAALFAVTLIASAKSDEDDHDERSLFSLWVVAVILLSPSAWIHYSVLLLIPFYCLALRGIQGQASRRALWAGAASYVATYVVVSAIVVINEIASPSCVQTFLMAEISFCPAALAYLSMYWLLRDGNLGSVQKVH